MMTDAKPLRNGSDKAGVCVFACVDLALVAKVLHVVLDLSIRLHQLIDLLWFRCFLYSWLILISVGVFAQKRRTTQRFW